MSKISDFGNNDVIRIDGSVEGLNTQSGQGVFLDYQDQTVDIGVKGVVFGAAAGLSAEGVGDIVDNSGHISGAIGVFANGSQGFDLVNSGEINGVWLEFATATTIDNSGSVRADSDRRCGKRRNRSKFRRHGTGEIRSIESSGNATANTGSITKGSISAPQTFSTTSANTHHQ